MVPPAHAAAFTPGFLFFDLKTLGAFVQHSLSHLIYTTIHSANANTFFDIYGNSEVIAKTENFRVVYPTKLGDQAPGRYQHVAGLK